MSSPTTFKRYIEIPRRYVAEEVVVKIFEFCNLDCDYCYMYNLQDQSWRTKPKVMTRRVIDALIMRLRRYMLEHQLAVMRIVLHGGEPLMAGFETLEYFLRTLKAATPEGGRFRVAIQTNGTLLNRQILNLFREYQVKVGVSLDGDRDTNDKHRIYRDGRGSYDKTVAGLNLLRDEFPDIYSGIISVIDPEQDLLATYRHHMALEPRFLRFLPPLGNHKHRPPMRADDPTVTPYADMMIPVFDAWYGENSRVQVSPFVSLVELAIFDALKGDFPWYRGVEAFGPWVVGALVVEVDGSYELLDGYRSVADGASRTGLNVFEHHMTEALVYKLEGAMAMGLVEPCDTCQKCPALKLCGGGLFLERYDGMGFINPSVYCPDWLKLAMHVKRRTREDLTKRGAAWVERLITPEHDVLHKA